MVIERREALDHRILGKEAPPTWKGDNVHDQFELVFGMRGGRLNFAFTKRPQPAPGSPSSSPRVPRPGRKTEALDVKIDRDCWIDITLKSDHARWSVKDAVTLGEEDAQHYFVLEYFVNGGWARNYVDGHWVQDPDDVPCKRIRFGAMLRGPGDKNDVPVNFNLDFEDDNGEFLPVSVDPDIKNPGTKP